MRPNNRAEQPGDFAINQHPTDLLRQISYAMSVLLEFFDKERAIVVVFHQRHNFF